MYLVNNLTGEQQNVFYTFPISLFKIYNSDSFSTL